MNKKMNGMMPVTPRPRIRSIGTRLALIAAGIAAVAGFESEAAAIDGIRATTTVSAYQGGQWLPGIVSSTHDASLEGQMPTGAGFCGTPYPSFTGVRDCIRHFRQSSCEPLDTYTYYSHCSNADAVEARPGGDPIGDAALCAARTLALDSPWGLLPCGYSLLSALSHDFGKISSSFLYLPEEPNLPDQVYLDFMAEADDGIGSRNFIREENSPGGAIEVVDDSPWRLQVQILPRELTPGRHNIAFRAKEGRDYCASCGTVVQRIEIVVPDSACWSQDKVGWHDDTTGQGGCTPCPSTGEGSVVRSGNQCVVTPPPGPDPMVLTWEPFRAWRWLQTGLMEEWHRSGLGQFTLAKCGTRLVEGDFNGDGLSDFACGYDYGGANSELWVHLSTGSKFTLGPWFKSGVGQFNMAACGDRFVVGDFNHDGRDDIACGYDYGGANSELFVFSSTGSSFTLQSAYRSGGQFSMPRCGNRFVVGDFNGDGKDDIACGYDYGGLDGELFAFLSTGSAFNLETWYRNGGQFSMPRCGNRFVVGDFNGDGKDDVACGYDYGAATGELFAFVSTGASFHLETWYHSGAGEFSMPQCGGRFVVGDFDADGRDDVACGYDYGSSSSEVFAFLSSGTGFSLRSWYKSGAGNFRMPSCDGRFHAADVNGDKRADLVCGYDYLDGHSAGLFHFLSTGTSLSLVQRFASTNFNMAACAGHFLTGNLTRDARSDTVCAIDKGDSDTEVFVWREAVARAQAPTNTTGM